MIGNKFNFEDVFFRDLTVCVLDTLEGQVNWVNRFSSGDIFVQVPFYYSLTGDERFLLDSFQDDIVSNNRFVELNTDQIPRGHLTMTGFNIKSDEFANPNVWLRMVVENEVEIRKLLARVRSVPITVNYELTILLSTEIDAFKCAQAIMDTMWIYKFMYFEYNFMNIDAVILMPDTNQIEMVREKNLTSDNSIKLKANFEVSTYYPAFRRDRVNAPGYTTATNSVIGPLGPINWEEWPDDPLPPNTPPPFTPPWPVVLPPSVPPYPPNWPLSSTNSLIVSPTGPTGRGVPPYEPPPPYPPVGFPNDVNPPIVINSDGSISSDPDYFMYAPKRTRWFNNILKAREKASMPSNNPFGQAPNRPNPNANPPTNPNA